MQTHYLGTNKCYQQPFLEHPLLFLWFVFLSLRDRSEEEQLISHARERFWPRDLKIPRYQFIPAVLFVSLCNLQEVHCFTVTSVNSCQATVSHLVNQCNSCQLFTGVNHYQKVDYYPSTKFQLWITDIIIPFSTCNSEDNIVELLNSRSSNQF